MVLALGCGKKTENASPPLADKPASSAPPAMTATPPPAGGPLTAQKIMGAGHVLEPFEPWDEALAKMQAALGPPTRVKHDRLANSDAYEWAAMDGEDCALVSVGKMDGKPLGKAGDVAGTAMPLLYKNDGKLATQRQECLDAAKAAK